MKCILYIFLFSPSWTAHHVCIFPTDQFINSHLFRCSSYSAIIPYITNRFRTSFAVKIFLSRSWKGLKTWLNQTPIKVYFFITNSSGFGYACWCWLTKHIHFNCICFLLQSDLSFEFTWYTNDIRVYCLLCDSDVWWYFILREVLNWNMFTSLICYNIYSLWN